MTTENMTIHKALCELKTLDSRIQDAIKRAGFCYASKHSNQKIHGAPIDDVKQESKAAYQSINALIARRNAIKRAVVLSNATTRVTIGGKEYTVAEAIEMKNNGMTLFKSLRDKLASDYRAASWECDEANGDRLERRADEYLKTLYTGFDPKNLSAEIRTSREDFIKAQTVELIDPIGVREAIDTLSANIDSFMVDVDSALSVSNAVTEITVEY